MGNNFLLSGTIPACLVISAMFGANEPSIPQPNIVFILSDDHSAPYLGCYGNKDLKTLNIDRIANQGIRFNHAYTTAPQCVPSRASIMTGRSVVDIRMTRFSAPLAASIISYPEKLREAGYFTGICGRSHHLDGSSIQPSASTDVFEKYNLKTFDNRVDFLRVSSGEKAFSEFKEFPESRPSAKPFFIQVGYNEPHRPFTATAFEPDPAKLTDPAGMPDTPELRKDLAGYYGEIQHLDSDVGKILNELDKSGLTENTLVIFMGDNGGALLRGKGTLFNCGLHVPLLACWPAVIKTGQVSDALISGEDIAPTLIELARAQVPEKITGISFATVLAGRQLAEREFVFACRGSHGAGLPTGSSAFDLGRTVFNKEFKLIYNALWQIPYEPVDFNSQVFWKELIRLNEKKELGEFYSNLLFSPERPMFQLFDLKNDPDEFVNLAGRPKYFEIEKLLNERLQKWMILNQDYLPLPVPPNNQGGH